MIRWLLLIAALCGVALMVLFSSPAAHSDPRTGMDDGRAQVVPHHWIQDNPHYVIPWKTTTHCCGPSHCQPAPAGAVVPEGNGWRVIGSKVGAAEDRVFTYEQTYTNEHDAQVWICTWNADSTGHKPQCLFTPLGS